MNKQELGNRGEKVAAAYLKSRGYKIIAFNYRCVLGEIDIIAAKKDVLVFIEVKSRTNLNYGYPQEGITPKKQYRLRNIAQCYLKEKGIRDVSCRFDVVSILFDGRKEQPISIELIDNAF